MLSIIKKGKHTCSESIVLCCNADKNINTFISNTKTTLFSLKLMKATNFTFPTALLSNQFT